MILKRLKLNTNLGEPTNCYIIVDEETREAMIIDPGGEPEKIIDMINVLNAKVKYIYLTHCHGDHVGGIVEVKNKLGGKILIHRIESENLENPAVTLNYYIGMEDIGLEADSRVDDNDIIHIGNIEFRVIHTPGHTNGSTSLYCDEYKMLFSGDTLFRGTWGRTDLPTGSMEDIMDSIIRKLLVLPPDTICYPGHRKNNNVKRGSTYLFGIKAKRRLKNVYLNLY